MKATNPDLIIAWTTGTPFGTILHSFKDVGLDVPLLTTNANSNRGILAQLATLMPKELYFPDPVTEIKVSEILDPRTRHEVESYHAAMNAVGVSQPDVPNGAGWDAGHLILEAYRKLGPNATSAQIRDSIARTRGWVGIRGPYDFRAYPQRGLSQPAVVMVRWDATAGEWNAVSKPGGAPL
jgi:branched-chain amino acid transport system substrate-binding protein